MKNSFYLVIPEQKEIPEKVRLFEEKALQPWIDELPVANPGLSTRLLFDLMKSFNALKTTSQARFDALEMLRTPFLIIEDYLRSRLIKYGFPKSQDDQQIFNVLVSLEKEMALGYWIVVKELTRRDLSWFQGKNIGSSIQKAMCGLSNIVVSHYIMGLSVPDWVWIDIHSLYKLGVKLKKDTHKSLMALAGSGKAMTIGDCYRQILLLGLAQPKGLMQKEVVEVFNFLESCCSLVNFSSRPVKNLPFQCVVLTDEDQDAHFVLGSDNLKAESSALYLDFLKFNKYLALKDKLIHKEQARFSSMVASQGQKNKLSPELLDYLSLRWSGVELKGSPIFSDRLGRYFCIGIDTTYELLTQGEAVKDSELMAESASERLLSSDFQKPGLLSNGSLVSFRKIDAPIIKRSLGVVCKIISDKSNNKVNFEIRALAGQVFAVNYFIPNKVKEGAEPEPQKALIYGAKVQGEEKSYIIMESFNLKDGDVIRMSMNKETFPIILRDRRNIGLGYWQFECRRLEEQVSRQALRQPDKGYDFI